MVTCLLGYVCFVVDGTYTCNTWNLKILFGVYVCVVVEVYTHVRLGMLETSLCVNFVVVKEGV